MRVLSLDELDYVSGGDGWDDFSDGGGGDFGDGGWGGVGVDFSGGADFSGGGGTDAAAAHTAPSGYHFTDVDPDGNYYMVKNGDSSNSQVFTPWAAEAAQQNYDALQKSNAQTGFGGTVILGPWGFANPGAAILGLGVGLITGAFALIGPPPKSPAGNK